MAAPAEIASALKPRLRGVLHKWGFVVGVPLAALLLASARDGVAVASLAVYVVGVLAMLGVSALYHRVGWGTRAKRVMQRMDHSTIFLAIAGTYTPITVLRLSGWTGPTLLITVWAGAIAGIALQWLPLHPPRWLFTLVYLLVGWAAVLAMPQIISKAGLVVFALVAGGGLAYTTGAVVYATRRPRLRPATFGFHELFHSFTLVGAGLHYLAIVLVARGA